MPARHNATERERFVGVVPLFGPGRRYFRMRAFATSTMRGFQIHDNNNFIGDMILKSGRMEEVKV